LAGAALLALAVAAPVVAYQLSLRGMSGDIPLYNANPYAGETVDPRGAEGTLWFDMTINPYKIKFVLAAHRLEKKTHYALVNEYAYDQVNKLKIHVLADGYSSRRGSLYLKGWADRDTLTEFSPTPWVSGAQVFVVKYDAIRTVDGQTYVDESAQVLWGTAGLPVVYQTGT
jgi:hypothetical protein